jgi:hypothetical protein
MAPTTDINPTATRQVFLSSDQSQRIVRVPAHDTLGHTADGDLAGKWRPNEPAEEWLRAHERFGIPHGFAEIDAVPSNSAVPLAKVTELLIEEDIEGLVELYEEEERGDNRPDVLKAAAGALAKLEAQQAADPAPAG